MRSYFSTSPLPPVQAASQSDLRLPRAQGNLEQLSGQEGNHRGPRARVMISSPGHHVSPVADVYPPLLPFSVGFRLVSVTSSPAAVPTRRGS